MRRTHVECDTRQIVDTELYIHEANREIVIAVWFGVGGKRDIFTGAASSIGRAVNES